MTSNIKKGDTVRIIDWSFRRAVMIDTKHWDDEFKVLTREKDQYSRITYVHLLIPKEKKTMDKDNDMALKLNILKTIKTNAPIHELQQKIRGEH